MTTPEQDGIVQQIQALRTAYAEAVLKEPTMPDPQQPPAARRNVEIIEALDDLRAEMSGAWQGMAQTLGTLQEAHAANLGDHIAEHRKATREAIGQHRLTVEQAVNALAATVRDGMSRHTVAVQGGLVALTVQMARRVELLATALDTPPTPESGNPADPHRDAR